VDNAFSRQTGNVGDSGERCAVHTNWRVCREGKYATATYEEIKRMSVSMCAGTCRAPCTRPRYSQLSRSRAILTHSHARAPPPSTPQAAQPGPLSAQEPLPTQRFLLSRGFWVGHAPGATHLPLQTTDGGWHMHIHGFSGGWWSNPSVHRNPQGFPLPSQTGMP
jgi:hypothetical protein